MTAIGRILRHLVFPQWLAARAFPRATLAAIETAVRKSEIQHEGELRFVVEAGLDLLPLLGGQTARARAIEVFAQLGVWDTEQNSGVLVYVQLVDHTVEIVADRGINARVDQHEWHRVCQRMEQAFHAGRFKEGALSAIDEITALLVAHFPASGTNRNELSDRPVVL